MAKNRERYIDAYRRLKAWEQAASARLRREIVVPFFGGCGCRMHNCLTNFENGHTEWPITVNGRTYSHAAQAKMAKRYNHEQSKIWAELTRLSNSFAKHF